MNEQIHAKLHENNYYQMHCEGGIIHSMLRLGHIGMSSIHKDNEKKTYVYLNLNALELKSST